MSRIYEAMKKVEGKKASNGLVRAANAPHAGVAEAVHNDGTARGARGIVSGLRTDGAPTTSGYLRLDELRLRCARPGWKLDPNTMVFGGKQSFTRCAEQFRTLRSRLYQLQQQQPVRIVLVTSALPGEGKSFVALNLAQAIVRQHERRALLIDADLRASKLHICMGAPSAPGLADYLCGEADEFSTIQNDAQDNLFLIAAGRPVSNPAELLANGRLKSLLDRLAPLFDWIIVDAPPVLPVSDASVLAGMCDGVILVVSAGSTAFDLAQAACQELQDKNLLGVVLNRAKEEATYGAYSYYGGNGVDKR